MVALYLDKLRTHVCMNSFDDGKDYNLYAIGIVFKKFYLIFLYQTIQKHIVATNIFIIPC